RAQLQGGEHGPRLHGAEPGPGLVAAEGPHPAAAGRAPAPAQAERAGLDLRGLRRERQCLPGLRLPRPWPPGIPLGHLSLVAFPMLRPLLALLASALLFAGGPPRRVVSQTLGTDELLLVLADPGQIVALSHLATDPKFSPVVKEASAYPRLKD